MKKQALPWKTKILVSIAILLGLLFVGTVIAALFGNEIETGNVAVVQIIGPIMSTDPGGFVAVATSTNIVEQLEKARDDDSIIGVILEINSPGGSAVASDEIAQAVKGLNKTSVAWIREVGASGGYWIASATDHVVANRMSVTGSIGVISSYLSFEEFLDDWNVTHNRLVAGDNKDVGSPFQRLQRSERAFLEEKLDRVHEFFIAEIAENRNLSVEDVPSDGSFFLGIEAYNLGLVDELGGKEEAENHIWRVTNTTVETITYTEEQGFLETLLGAFREEEPMAQIKTELPFVPMLR
ncbi:MAG: signal peptide peptidase SppA [Candidatus Woesearchaeota archaeon]|nr:signal peptide peptidase SppA [Candidatus Woesearchaeota archaeon]